MKQNSDCSVDIFIYSSCLYQYNTCCLTEHSFVVCNPPIFKSINKSQLTSQFVHMVAILVRLSQSDFLSFYSSDLQPTVLTAILLSSRRVNKPLWWLRRAKQTPDFTGHITYWYERKKSLSDR